jgi:hypothetical protein
MCDCQTPVGGVKRGRSQLHTAVRGTCYEPSSFCFEASVARGGQKLAVLRLHHDATPDSAVEVTVDFHFNQLFVDI